jgi:hypothetical protein
MGLPASKILNLELLVRQRHYSKEELARCGHELHESSIQQKIEAGNEGKIVAINQVKSCIVR